MIKALNTNLSVIFRCINSFFCSIALKMLIFFQNSGFDLGFPSFSCCEYKCPERSNELLSNEFKK